jgi:hypothetical protein
MKITVRTIVNPAFAEAYARLLAMPLEAKDAYWIAKSLPLLDTEVKAFQVGRLTAMRKYGFADGTPITPDKQDDLKKADAELEEILKREVELPLRQVTIPQNTVLTARDLVALEGIVTVHGFEEPLANAVTNVVPMLDPACQ